MADKSIDDQIFEDEQKLRGLSLSSEGSTASPGINLSYSTNMSTSAIMITDTHASSTWSLANLGTVAKCDYPQRMRVPEIVRCKYCGTKNKFLMSLCEACGAPLP